jgi:hypothetical protein
LPPREPPLPHLASISVVPSVPSRLTRLLSSCVGLGAPSRLDDTTPLADSQRTPLFQRGQSITTGEHRRRALCAWAALGFQPNGHFKIENSFSIFHSISFQIQTLKIHI